MKLNLKSFTLIEVLLVSTLIAVLGLAVFQSFANGLKLWSRAQRLNREADVAIFLDKMGVDLRSSVSITGIGFKGTSEKVSFPAIVLTNADPNSSRAPEGLIDQIGAVQYRYEPGDHIIYRRQANYSQALKGNWSLDESAIVSGIDALDFHYEISSDKGFLLKPDVNDGVPSGVMVDVHFSDDTGEHELKRYLSIPIGS